MDEGSFAAKAAKWLTKHGQCNGSAVVSPFPVYQTDRSSDSGALSSRARRAIGKRGEAKLIGILGAENHEERRQIRAFLDQQYVKARNTGDELDTEDESSEFDRMEQRSPLHVSLQAVKTRGLGRKNGTVPPQLPRAALRRDEVFSIPNNNNNNNNKYTSSRSLLSEQTPPLSPSLNPYSGSSSPRKQVQEVIRNKHHLSPISCLRPVLYSSSHQQTSRKLEVPGVSRSTYSYSPLSPHVASDEEGIFAKAHQDPPRLSFRQPGQPYVTFGLSEPQSPYFSPRLAHSQFSSPRPSFCQSPRPKVVLCEKLGCGSYSIVYRGEYSQTGQQVAVKVLHDDERISPKEVSVLSRLDHQNIVKYHGTTTLNDGRYCILLELMKCSLASVIKESNGLEENVLRDFTRQILSGLEYLHSMNIVHRDVKCANILLDGKGIAKLADFGLAKKIDYSLAKSCKGTIYYMAPEVLLNEGHYGLAADVWSLGCTVIEMAVGKPPWSGFGMMPFYESMKEGYIPPICKRLSPEAASFIKSCLIREPRKRPSAASLLSHPFLHGEKAIKLGHPSVKNVENYFH